MPMAKAMPSASAGFSATAWRLRSSVVRGVDLARSVHRPRRGGRSPTGRGRIRPDPDLTQASTSDSRWTGGPKFEGRRAGVGAVDEEFIGRPLSQKACLIRSWLMNPSNPSHVPACRDRRHSPRPAPGPPSPHALPEGSAPAVRHRPEARGNPRARRRSCRRRSRNA